ncbi:MAG: sulfite reductase, partial [Simkaniaceae bacterium]|nr:sulfite reductase [Simkaniaceae bacterium]
TGIAPFRAFLQERALHPTENWLFFGERNRATDFYYRDFLETLSQEKKLRLDLAFSRDQNHKIYVQDLIRENGKDVWEWIDKKNATLYLCGDAKQMAKAVNMALHDIAQAHGGHTIQTATDYIKQLRKNKRCLMDVY